MPDNDPPEKFPRKRPPKPVKPEREAVPRPEASKPPENLSAAEQLYKTEQQQEAARRHAREIAQVYAGRTFPLDQEIVKEELKKGFLEEAQMMGRQYNPEELDLYVNQVIAQASSGPRERQGYGLTEKEQKQILEAAEKDNTGEKAWEVIDRFLCEVFDPADANIAEVLQLDLNSAIKLVDIFHTVLKIPGEKGEALRIKTSLMNSLRRLTHNALWMMESGQGKPDKMADYMQQSSELIDLLFDTKGTASAFRFYEKVMKQMQARGGNWIEPERMMFRSSGQKVGRSELDEKARALFVDALKKGAVDNHGPYATEEELNREWPAWKIRQALSLGKSFGAISLRFPQITAATRLPEADLMVSAKYEDFVRPLNPVEHLLRKFGGYGPAVSLFYYILTGEQKLFKKTEEAYKAFSKIKDNPLMHDAMTAADLFEYNGPTASEWRTALIAGKFKTEEERKKLGIQAHLLLLEAEKDQKMGKASTPEEKQVIEAEFKQKSQEAWRAAARRSPLLILRMLTEPDEAGRDFGKYQQLVNREVFGRNKVSEEELDQLENELFVLEEEAVRKKRLELNYDLIKDPGLRRQVRAYAQAIEKVFSGPGAKTKVVENGQTKEISLVEAFLNKREIAKRSPYSLETSDMAFEQMEFAKTGHIGWLARAFRDYKDLYDATLAIGVLMDKLPRATKGVEIAELIHGVYWPLQDIHRSTGLGMAKKLMEGVIRASKNYYPWAPWPYNVFKKAREEPESFIQHLYGRNAIAWDKIEQRNFVKHMRWWGMNESSKEMYDKFQLHRKHCFLELGVKYGPFALALWLYAVIKWLTESLKEETKEV